MKQTSLKRRRRESGSSIVEVALLSPWIFFLFVGVFDFGSYAYAAISTQNAARAVALAAAQTMTSSLNNCTVALGEMRMLPNVLYAAAASKCTIVTGAGNGTVTQTAPIAVCVATLTNTASSPCGLPSAIACADCAQPGASTATSLLAVVTYQTIPLVPIPGILTGQVTLSRGAEERRTKP